MNRQAEHDAERRMGETLREPCPQQFGILEAILPGVRTSGRWEDDIIGHSALHQIEQRILKAT